MSVYHNAGSGDDALVLYINQDAYFGNAIYEIEIDGEVIGTYEASALRSEGDFDVLTVKGNWAKGAHNVKVTLVNDLWHGTPDTDRNVYVAKSIYNGVEENHNLMIGYLSEELSFTDTGITLPQLGEPVSHATGAGPDTLVLHINQDAYLGNAQYQVEIDGKVIGVFEASALRSSGKHDTLTIKGDWGKGAHDVKVTLVNDLWHGTSDTDRNVYVVRSIYNGAEQNYDLMIGHGSKFFEFTDAGTPTAPNPEGGTPVSYTTGTGPDTLVLHINQDAYKGNAQYQVEIDGKVIGAYEAGALHGSGKHDTLTIKGDWGGGQHNVKVTLLNDLWEGSAAADRNVYVVKSVYNGVVDNKEIMVGYGSETLRFTDTAPVPDGNDGGEFRVVLSDDFNNNVYDYSKWGAPFDGGVYWNNAWSWGGGDVAVRSGELQVSMTRHDDGWWTGGGFNSFKAGNTITYGTVEFDARMEEAQGTMTAILMWPYSDVWPRDGEIDILETPGNDVMHTLHWGGGPNEDQDHYDAIRNQSYDPSTWHHYKMTWLPDMISITVDGREVARWTEHIPDGPMGFGAMGMVGASFDQWIGGAPDNTTPDKVTLHLDNIVMSQWTGGTMAQAFNSSAAPLVDTSVIALKAESAPEVNVVLGDKEANTLLGDDDNGRIVGSAGNDVLHGSKGNDVLLGQDGSDRLYGGDGNDRLRGGNGNDVLFGGKGNDVLVGGAGADRFIFDNNGGLDRVTGYELSDIIDISRVLEAYDPVSDAISDFVRFRAVADGGSVLQVNTDGHGTDFISIAKFNVDLSQQNLVSLIDDGKLVA